MKSLRSISLALGVAFLAAWSGPANAAEVYLLGPGDKVAVTLRDLKEIEFPQKVIAPDGSLEYQYTGRLEASGQSTDQLARLIEERLKKVVRDPKVVVEVLDYGSQPVSVLGAVHKPGTHQLRGGKTLIEVISMAEGLTPEAGNTVLVSRPKTSGSIPLLGTGEDANLTVARINLKRLLDGTNPGSNILIRPGDVISVPRAELIYVVGNVKKPGGFTLAEKESLSTLQAVALAEGLDGTAAPKSARILRSTGDGPERKEIPIDLSRILSSQAPDQLLQPNDILFIPNSAVKSTTRKALEVGIQMATGVVIFRR